MVLICHPSEDHRVLARERVFLRRYLSCPVSLVTFWYAEPTRHLTLSSLLSDKQKNVVS